MATLKINNLHVEVEGKEILKGVTTSISEGETVALLGPNGHGKSTLLNVIMGHPRYKITSGSLYLDDVDLTNMTTDERAKAGLFLALQNPAEVPGVINSDFLRAAVNATREEKVSTYKFYKMLDSATKELKMPFDLATRSLNEGFSGGEKKRNEILQLLLLNPKIAMLDEIDSGLDVEVKIKYFDISNINNIQIPKEYINVIYYNLLKEEEKGMGFLVISHYARLFDLIKPTRAIVMINGKIVLDGDISLIKRIDQNGYEFIKTELGIEIEKEDNQMNTVSIGTCAVKETIK